MLSADSKEEMASNDQNDKNLDGNEGSANLIVNYLPQTMSDEQFRVLFAKYGDIRSARIIRNKTSGYSYGFGFVEYFQTQDAEMAIKNLNGYLVDNSKKIKVSFARPSSNQIKNANIFVTNLPPNFSENDLRQLFGQCGEIIQCRLLANRAGTAFVLFNLNEEAKQAITMFNKKLLPGTNCRINVKFASGETNKKSPVNNLNYMNHSSHQQDYHQNLYSHRVSGPIRNNNNHNNNRYNPLSYYSLQQPVEHHGQMSYNSNTHNNNNLMERTGLNQSGSYHSNNSMAAESTDGEYVLFVYNIGPETDETSLGKLFSFYGQVLKVDVIRKGRGESKGYGFVTMKYYQDAFNAIQSLNGYQLVNNRPLQVSFKKG